jgi:hypothetical protein
MLVSLWVCRKCGNYFGSSSQADIDLTQEQRLSRVEDRDEAGERILKGTRADCPNGCGPREKVAFIEKNPQVRVMSSGSGMHL